MKEIEESPEDGFEYSEGEDFHPETHNKLLTAISQLYKKQRIVKPKRSEPSSNISEFNLSHKTKQNNKKLVNVNELLSNLNKKATHKQIQDQVKSVSKKSRPLPKALEKLHEDKLKRKIGYVRLQRKLNQWDAVVERNRATDQQTFPLKQEQISIQESNDFMVTFKEPTELEKEVAAILHTSEIAQKENKIEEELFPLSLEEIIEQRKTIARMRARESYRIARAVRQNKIKSKKYHRILKREKLKKELKDFEILQKTNPEAALEKLEKLERARAEERISLRHRNTGKWARRRAITAKYDKEARAELAEQLAKSRELTKKIQSGFNSDSEGEEGDINNLDAMQTLDIDPSNPWIQKQESEIESFVGGFRKFQENQKLEQNQQKIENNSANSEINLQNKSHVVQANGNSNFIQITDRNTSQLEQSNVNEKKSSEEETTKSRTNENSLSETELPIVEDVIVSNLEKDHLNDEELIDAHGESENSRCLDMKEQNSLNRSSVISDKSANIVGNLCLNGSTINKRPTKCKRNIGGRTCSFSKSNITKVNSTQKVQNQSGLWAVSSLDLSQPQRKEVISMEDVKSSNNLSIDSIFDNAENKLRKNLITHINTMRSHINSENDVEVKEPNKPKTDKSNLSFKKSNKRPDIDASLIEGTNEGISSGLNDIKNLIQVYEKNKTDEVSNIDPHKFLPVKPVKLHSASLDLVENLDEPEDEENEEKQRQLNLEEAFAEDDVVDQFRREKEEEVENSKPKTIDLTLPGWGKWGGEGIVPKPLNKLKRKNRRLIIKFPEIPRKDDNKDNIIIHAELQNDFKKRMVHDLPFPFRSVKDYEASIRYPIGNTWMPQSAFMKLIVPPVVTKMGSIIEPMNKSELLKKDGPRFRKKRIV